MKKVFITGESGTIPMAMQRLAKANGLEVINTQFEDNFLTNQKTHQSFKVRKPEIDFLNRDFLLNYKDLWEQVDLIIHSGAYVGTDFCSSEPEMAIKTNVQGTMNIVDICNKYSISLVYFSTTAIFDPSDYSKLRPMTETTRINPQTLYGITKYTGELIVQRLCKTKSLVVRPVFGFGDYPEDLHSALTKIIYVIYRNLKGKETNLTVLLDKNIEKSYTRVENIAATVLHFINDDINDINLINVGEHHNTALNWHYMLELIVAQFCKRNLCSQDEVRAIFMKQITFVPGKDYLHYHNLNNHKLEKFGYDLVSLKDYISLENGISLTLDSVIKNIEQEPYWL